MIDHDYPWHPVDEGFDAAEPMASCGIASYEHVEVVGELVCRAQHR
jgi:hypothetical protein